MGFIKGYIPWNKGKKGTLNNGSFKPGMIPHNKGKKHVHSGSFKVGHAPLNHIILKGKNAGGYIDGHTLKYHKRLKKHVRIRDDYVCQRCTTRAKGHRVLIVHHIHHDHKNSYPDLITVCPSCHSWASKYRDESEIFFMNILNIRELLFWKPPNEDIFIL